MHIKHLMGSAAARHSIDWTICVACCLRANDSLREHARPESSGSISAAGKASLTRRTYDGRLLGGAR